MTAQMLVTRGLPGGGKSTFADQTGLPVVSRDSIRFENPGMHERNVTKIHTDRLRQIMQTGSDVVVDNTHISQRSMSGYTTLAQEFGYEIVEQTFWHVPLMRCIINDAERDESKRVGQSVIIRMAIDSGRYEQDQFMLAMQKVKSVIIDLDGTACNIEHRRHFVQVPEGEKRQWKPFFEAMDDDTPMPHVKFMFDMIRQAGEYVVIFASGRSADYRKRTETWLKKHGFDGYFLLLMRNFGDFRDDVIVKQEMLDRYIRRFNPQFAIDDRDRVVKMWRDNGIPTFQAAPGDF